MPAVSDKQRRFFGAVLAAKRGQLKNPSPAVEKAALSMNENQVVDFASNPMGEEEVQSRANREISRRNAMPTPKRIYRDGRWYTFTPGKNGSTIADLDPHNPEGPENYRSPAKSIGPMNAADAMQKAREQMQENNQEGDNDADEAPAKQMVIRKRRGIAQTLAIRG